jgi:hypothetical protein
MRRFYSQEPRRPGRIRPGPRSTFAGGRTVSCPTTPCKSSDKDVQATPLRQGGTSVIYPIPSVGAIMSEWRVLSWMIVGSRSQSSA